MKKILEFNSPEDDYSFEVAEKGYNFLRSLDDLDELFRRHIKYDSTEIQDNFDEAPEDVKQAIDKTVAAIRQMLHKIRLENNAYLNE